MKIRILLAFGWLTLLFAFTAAVQAQPLSIDYTTNGDGSLNVAFCFGYTQTLIIPDTVNGLRVTSIGQNACQNRGMTSLNIGNNVSNIGQGAFEYNTALTNIIFGTNIATIGDDAFEECISLANVTLPNSVTNIGNDTFYECYDLTSATIPDSVITVGGVAFEECRSLTNVIIGTNVTTIGGNAFGSCAKLTSVTIPNSVVSVGDIFYACTGLATVTIGNGLTNIAGNMFFGCTSLRRVFVAGNASSVETNAFQGYSNLTIYYLPGTSGWTTNFYGIPTLPWLPQVATDDGSFGFEANGFGFDVTWASGQTVIVDACTNLMAPNWVPMATNALASGSFYFNDSQWTNYPGRFYRLRAP